MLSKNEVKYIISLSDKKNRDQEGVFVAEGPKLVNELKAYGLASKIIYTTDDTETDSAKEEIKKITVQDLQRISHFEKANQTLGVFYKKYLPPFHLQNTVSLALDGIQDPGNLGTILRTADWFGITQIFASLDTVDCYNPKVVQSTMGSIARVKVYYNDLPFIFSSTQVPVIGALLNGENIYHANTMKEGILVIGNESKGIRENIIPFILQSVTIPGCGSVESLNAAVATGILLSHLIKNISLKK